LDFSLGSIIPVHVMARSRFDPLESALAHAHSVLFAYVFVACISTFLLDLLYIRPLDVLLNACWQMNFILPLGPIGAEECRFQARAAIHGKGFGSSSFQNNLPEFLGELMEVVSGFMSFAVNNDQLLCLFEKVETMESSIRSLHALHERSLVGEDDFMKSI
jgi:hypothetical protein